MEKVRKQLLQASINHGIMPIDTVKRVVAALCEEYDVNVPENLNGLKDLIMTIDSQIKKYDQTLQFIKHPLNGVEYMVFALLLTNQACKFQPNYADTERKYFYKLLEILASSEDYGTEWNNIYAVADQLPTNAKHSISKERIQELENLWVSQGYFLELDEKIYFGPRTMLEYGKYLKNNFTDFISHCILCNNIVYWDVKCSKCEVKLHRDCIRKYLIKMNSCPSCKRKWNTPLN